jgi:hypothetical protein
VGKESELKSKEKELMKVSKKVTGEYVRFGPVLIPCVDAEAERRDYTKHAIGWAVAGVVVGVITQSLIVAFILWTIAGLVYWNGRRK